MFRLWNSAVMVFGENGLGTKRNGTAGYGN